MTLNCSILTKYINKNDSILIGVSGGADSMCLLDMVKEYSKTVEFKYYAVHVNHNLRADEAMRDEDFVKKYCQISGIDFIIVSIETKKYAQKYGKTIEQAGRELRYKELDKLCKEKKANKILIAHHSSDQAETVLMHIARGSSLKGAKGMNDTDGAILRPLLNYSREEILKYNDNNNVPYIQDSSNDDIKYSRNYIRLEIMPALKNIYPNIENSLCSFASHCARDEDFINSVIPRGILSGDSLKANIGNEIIKLHSALSTRIIKRAFEQIGVYADIEEKHILQVLELFDFKNGSELSLPNKVRAYKEYDSVVITKANKKILSQSVTFALGETKIKGYGTIYVVDITDKQEPEFGDGNHYVDMQKIPVTAVWRTRKQGDIFAKLGSGSKKLSDYFTDKKIPKRERDLVPVLAVDNKILVVAGFDISDSVKLTADSEQIIKLIYIPQI